MARPSLPARSRVARVRAYFGITQRELAAYLGISEPLLNHFDAARRMPGPEVMARLEPLLNAVPADAAAEPLPLLPPAGTLVPGPLEARLDVCLHTARNLRWQLRHLPDKARQAARWARALPALQAALPPPTDLPPPADLPAQYEAIRLTYVRAWLDTQATTLDPETLTQWHLLHTRATALEAEAATLAALLGLPPPDIVR